MIWRRCARPNPRLAGVRCWCDRPATRACLPSRAPSTARVALQTSQPVGATLNRVFPADPETTLTAEAKGRVTVTLAPLQYALWRAAAPLSAPPQAPSIARAAPANAAVLSFLVRELDGYTLLQRQELSAEVTGADGLAEVTFVMTRASRPGQYELLGSDDAAPFRLFLAAAAGSRARRGVVFPRHGRRPPRPSRFQSQFRTEARGRRQRPPCHQHPGLRRTRRHRGHLRSAAGQCRAGWTLPRFGPRPRWHRSRSRDRRHRCSRPHGCAVSQFRRFLGSVGLSSRSD